MEPSMAPGVSAIRRRSAPPIRSGSNSPALPLQLKPARIASDPFDLMMARRRPRRRPSQASDPPQDQTGAPPLVRARGLRRGGGGGAGGLAGQRGAPARLLDGDGAAGR